MCGSSWPATRGMLARQGLPMDLQVEPTERGWEMVSILRKNCRFPGDLEMEVYAGIVGKEAAIMFMRWLADRKGRPLTAAEVLNDWRQVCRAGSSPARRRPGRHGQRPDRHTAGRLPHLNRSRKQIWWPTSPCCRVTCASASSSPCSRFPEVALLLAQDKHDGVILDAIQYHLPRSLLIPMSISSLENAVVRLLRERPFYGHFILNLRREQRALAGKPAGVTIRDGIPILAVDPACFDLPGSSGAAGAAGTSGQAPAAPAHAAPQRAQPA